MDELTIYDVPACSTCRRLKALLAERGVPYTGIDYHRRGLAQDELRALLRRADVGARALLRVREPLAAELGLLDAGVDDERLIALMVRHPRLLQRPIVVRGERALLARPVERVLELLD